MTELYFIKFWLLTGFLQQQTVPIHSQEPYKGMRYMKTLSEDMVNHSHVKNQTKMITSDFKVTCFTVLL